MFKFLKKLKLSLESGTQIQMRIAKAYNEGVADATKELQKNIEIAQKRITALTNELLEQEQKYRTLYQRQIAEFQNHIKTKCNKCQAINNAERDYLRSMQQVLATQLKKVDYMFSRIYEYLEMVKSSHQEIMLNAGRVSAMDYIIKNIEDDLKLLIKHSAKYLLTDVVEKEFPEKQKIINSISNNNINKDNKNKKEG